MLSSITGLYPLNPPAPVVTTKDVSRHGQMCPRGSQSSFCPPSHPRDIPGKGKCTRKCVALKMEGRGVGERQSIGEESGELGF